MDNIKDIHIADIYRKKIDTISGETSVKEAVQLLDKKHTNAFVVLNEERKVVGILSLQEIIQASIPSEFKANMEMAKAMYKKGYFLEICNDLKEKKVADIMRKDFISIDIKSNLLVLIGEFVMSDIYLIPVFDGEKFIGTISRTQLKKAFQLAFHLSY